MTTLYVMPSAVCPSSVDILSKVDTASAQRFVLPRQLIAMLQRIVLQYLGVSFGGGEIIHKIFFIAEEKKGKMNENIIFRFLKFFFKEIVTVKGLIHTRHSTTANGRS